jgi:hypothetical protein
MAQAAGKSSKDSSADLMSLYRFLGNDKISISDLRKARAQLVLEALGGREHPVLVVHDVTQLDYTRHDSKEDRKLIGDHKGKGYEYITCIGVDAQDGRIAGVLHDTLVNDNGPDDGETMDYDYEKIFEGFSKQEKDRLRKNHRHQMAVHINGLSPMLGDRQAIHVADCEFDDIFILERCNRNAANFVIRTTGNRNVEIPQASWIPEKAKTSKQGGHPGKEGMVCVNLRLLMESIPVRPYKSISLDSKGHLVQPEHAIRQASLSLGAVRVRLYRHAKRNKKYAPTPCAVETNMVLVREVEAPADGTKPLCWILFTSLPINSVEQQAYVADLYRLRWKIEEYFKLVKSGYLIESSRLDRAEKIAKQLVVITLAAMVVTNLKADLNLNSKGPLSKTDYDRIKNARRNIDDPSIDIKLRLFCLLLKLGGWIGRRADPIGPAVLMRGIQQLYAAFQVYSQYPEIIAYGVRNPKEIEHFLGLRI